MEYQECSLTNHCSIYKIKILPQLKPKPKMRELKVPRCFPQQKDSGHVHDPEKDKHFPNGEIPSIWV